MEKLKEKEESAAAMQGGDGDGDGAGGGGGDDEDEVPDLDPAVSEAYDHIGTYLKRYKSGKLPKAFKMIPNLKHWEYVLGIYYYSTCWYIYSPHLRHTSSCDS
jgi:essential nuclear protein 1